MWERGPKACRMVSDDRAALRPSRSAIIRHVRDIGRERRRVKHVDPVVNQEAILHAQPRDEFGPGPEDAGALVLRQRERACHIQACTG